LGLPGGHAKRGLVAVIDIQYHEIMGAERGGRTCVTLQAAGSWDHGE